MVTGFKERLALPSHTGKVYATALFWKLTAESWRCIASLLVADDLCGKATVILHPSTRWVKATKKLGIAIACSQPA